MFNVVKRLDLSLTDLRKLRNKGVSVMKTPHVGNVYPNNMLCADMGVKMLFYDRTRGDRDKNFHPHKLIVNGGYTDIASAEILTTHNRTNVGNHLFSLGESISEVHMRSFRKAFPKADAITYTEYLRVYKDLILGMLDVVSTESDLALSRWVYYVTPQGERIKKGFMDWLSIKRDIFGLTNEEYGWLIPNSLNVLITGVIESIVTSSDEVYHLSGPDMVKYINSHLKILSQAYSCLLESEFGKLLSPELIYNLVPVAGNKLVVPMSKSDALDDLVSTYLDHKENEAKRGGLARSANAEERKRVVSGFGEARQQERAVVKSMLAGCSEIFQDIYCANYFSHWDIATGKDELYYTDWTVNARLSEIDAAFDLFNKNKPKFN